VPVLNKAIQELFDTYGRMNATLGVEVPFTNQNIQTTVPLGYIDPATESISDGETQIWKITHNGVDTHPVHFHLVNVQVINRIGWDGTVKPPNANEVGWKETVRMNPLEDVIVAVRAKKPTLPGFGLPHSVRPLDPTQAIGATMGFSNLDPLTGNAMVPAVTNQVTDFGWEYVWHCHILGHEENDFMRPFIFQVTDTLPISPTGLAAKLVYPSQVNLTWSDNANNEIGYRIERRVGNGAYTVIKQALANATGYSDASAALNTAYSYRVTAFNAAGNSQSASVSISTPRVTGTILINGGAATTKVTAVTLSLTAKSASGTVTQMQFSQNGGNSWTAYEAFSATKALTLASSSNGLKTVSVRFKDSAGNVSSSFSATINLDTSLPVATILINGGALTTASSNVTLTLSATDADPVTQMQFSNDGGTTWSAFEPFSTTRAMTLTPAGSGIKTVAVRVMDALGSVSLSYSASITLNLPTVSSVSLTPVQPSPQQVGIAQVVFNAAATGGTGTYEYAFWYRLPTDTTWTLMQPYSQNASWTWNSAAKPVGTYYIQVYARSAGSILAYEAVSAKSFVITPLPATGATLIAAPTSPQVTGIPQVVFNASATGGSGTYEYAFYYRLPTATSWTLMQGYSQNASWAWNTAAVPAGTYYVQVYARSVGSVSAYEAIASKAFVIAPLAATGVALTSPQVSPQAVGTPQVVFNASATGGSGTYEYAFYYRLPTATTWTLMQSYSQNASWTWNTSAVPAGTYYIQVYARSAGSTAAYEAISAISYAFSVPPTTAVTLTPAPSSPQAAGIPQVVFNAAGSGGTGSYEYEFWYRLPTDTSWTLMQAYGQNSSWTWNTAAVPAGTYYFQVYARTLGSTAAYEAVSAKAFVLQ